MSDQAAKELASRLMDAIEVEARKHLPSYIQDSWLSALSSLFSAGLYHLWVSIISNVVNIETNSAEIIDERPGLTEGSVKNKVD